MQLLQNSHSKNQIDMYSFDYLFTVPVSPSKRLEFELLDETNYKLINQMFSNDDSPFTELFYRREKELEEYFQLYQTNLKLRGKDWLIKSIDKQEYVGMFHLYDLSRETVNNRNKRCCIGFAIKPESRRKYYASEAIVHFLDYIFTNLPIEKVLAYTDKDNTAVCKLLKNLQFKFNVDDYMYSETTHHFEMFKSEFYTK